MSITEYQRNGTANLFMMFAALKWRDKWAWPGRRGPSKLFSASGGF